MTRDISDEVISDRGALLNSTFIILF